MEAAKKAAYRAVSGKLRNATDAEDRVLLDFVPDKTTRPYLLIQTQAQTQRNFHTRQQDPSFVLLIKAVALDDSTALDIMQQALQLLDDQGEQDLGGLSGGNDWHILKATVEEFIHQQYKVGTSTHIFEQGFQIRIVMQEADNG
jgi:hypothetical protein